MAESVMRQELFVQGLLDFIRRAPTPFHAVSVMASMLEAAGFSALCEKDDWPLHQAEPGGRYYVIRNDSSIVAFRLNQPLATSGMRMLGAHTDSPCLKVKPRPEVRKHGYLQLGVEVYGGALLSPWFDRDLSLAGRVSVLNEQEQIEQRLIDWEQPIAVIPSLAIHLDRQANENRSINKQQHLPPVLMKLPDDEAGVSFHALLLQQLNQDCTQGAADCPAHRAVRVLDYELGFYDMQPPAITGLQGEFISAARLDNLLSCYTSLMALIDDQGADNVLLVCTDHEEVGSVSAAGAQGSLLKSVLLRLCESEAAFARMIASSLMVSVDNAHAVHPNYADKHECNHGPVMNGGPVIKTNANQRYASNSETSALFKHCCARADVPVQSFVVRSDMACGSTIGPITAGLLGVRTVDVGVPTLAMHSIRELAGSLDAHYLYRVLRCYFDGAAAAAQ